MNWRRLWLRNPLRPFGMTIPGAASPHPSPVRNSRRFARQKRLRSLEALETRDLLTTFFINEVNYNPSTPVPSVGDVGDDNEAFEFIEIINASDQPQSLEGVRLVQVTIGDKTEGVNFQFPPQTMQPGERIVVVEDPVAFASRYGQEVPVAGTWQGGLSNGGEQLTLVDGTGTVLDEFSYDSGNGWPSRADGLGSTLERKDFLTDPNTSDAWRSSVVFGGTPGTPEPEDRDPRVIINEVLAHTDDELGDRIELFNPSAEEINVSGWYLTDNENNLRAYRFPAGSRIPANGYLVVNEAQFNPGENTLPNDFALSEFGDEVWLMSAYPNGKFDRFEDRVEFGATTNGVTVGNVNNIDNRTALQPLALPSLGQPNGPHRVGEAVITEIQYHPLNDDVSLEFIELRNTGVNPLQIDGYRIADAVDYLIPPNTTIPASGTVVLVAFDPNDAQPAGIFRDYYGIDESVTLLGPWGTDDKGNPDALSNNGEMITLTVPEDDITGISYVAIDQVEFNDKGEWPTVADGLGASVSRKSPVLYGHDPANWVASIPTPGDQGIPLPEFIPLSVDEPVAGEIGTDDQVPRGAVDLDYYRFVPSETAFYKFETSIPETGGSNTFLRIYDDQENQLAANDNISDDDFASRVQVELDAGEEYWIVVAGSAAHAEDFNPFTGQVAVAGSIGLYSIEVQLGTAPLTWQNPVLKEDVDGNGVVVPFDALTVINALNAPSYSAEPLDPPSAENSPPPYLDVNGDGFLSPIDALMVINRLNAAAAQAEPEAFASNLNDSAETAQPFSALAAAVDAAFESDHDRTEKKSKLR